MYGFPQHLFFSFLDELNLLNQVLSQNNLGIPVTDITRKIPLKCSLKSRMFTTKLNDFHISIVYIYIEREHSFFPAAVVSILLYGCTTWALTKCMEKKLDSNYTRMLQAMLNKSWWQHPKKQQLYSHLPPIIKTIQVR